MQNTNRPSYIMGGDPSQDDPPPLKSSLPLTPISPLLSFLVLSLLCVVAVILCFSCNRKVVESVTLEPERAQVVQIFPDEEDPPALVPKKCAEIVAIRLYFGFDRSDVDSDGVKVVEGLAGQLRGCGDKIEVSGHCDSRGSREYNQGLGQRRAGAVSDLLVSLGIESPRISVVSYGEDRPAVGGCVDEDCHGKNRRVEIQLEGDCK